MVTWICNDNVLYNIAYLCLFLGLVLVMVFFLLRLFLSFVPNVSSFSGFPFLVVPHVFFSNVYFVLCFLYLMVPISLDCPFLIVPSIFFKVYFFLGVVYTILLVSLDWIVHSWFFHYRLLTISFSGFFILRFHFGFYFGYP